MIAPRYLLPFVVVIVGANACDASPSGGPDADTADANDASTSDVANEAAGDANDADAPSGPTYYVSPTGSDTADGSQVAPWKTPQHAADTAPAGATIFFEDGSYVPFAVHRPGLTFRGVTATGAKIVGAPGVQNVVTVAANDVTLASFVVTGCVPNAKPPGSFEATGSAGVRLDDGTTGATLDGLVVTASDTTTNSDGLPFGCYGVLTHNANGFVIQNSTLSHNGTGVFVNGGGQNAIIRKNLITDNDVLIRNTKTPTNDDYGAIGISLGYTSVSPGVVASGNVITNNFGPSADYGVDGGAFEIYEASNVTMDGNTISNNDDILETGAGSGQDCANNVFTNNIAQGATMGSSLTDSGGMLLRCAHNMKVDGNQITDVRYWAIDIEQGGTFGGVHGSDGLVVTHNTISQSQAGGFIYALGYDTTGHGLTVDANKLHFGGSVGKDWNAKFYATIAAWHTATGFDATSTSF